MRKVDQIHLELDTEWRTFGVDTPKAAAEKESDEDTAFMFIASRRSVSARWTVPDRDEDLLAGIGAWGTTAAKDDETFKTLLMMQMANEL